MGGRLAGGGGLGGAGRGEPEEVVCGWVSEGVGRHACVGWQLCCGRRGGVVSKWSSAGVCRRGTMQGGYVCRIVRSSQKPSILYIYIGPRNMRRASMMDVTTRSPHHPCPAIPKPHKLTCSHPPHFTSSTGSVVPVAQTPQTADQTRQHSSSTMLLPTLIDLRRPAGKPLDPEDIFGSSLGGVFTDDLQNQHGDDPDTTIVYKNLRHGDVEFRAAEVDGEEQRRKMAHYLWNAGVLMAELVGGRPSPEAQSNAIDMFGIEGWRDGKWWVGSEEEGAWSVKGERVVELGAGALGRAREGTGP